MLFSNNIDNEIERFFSSPSDSDCDTQMSLLCLLRTDLQHQYGKECDPPAKVNSPLLTCLGIMVGFELLTKLWSGNHAVTYSATEDFLCEVSKIERSKAQALVQFRHALAHGYRLGTKRKKDNQFYSFIIDDATDCPQCISEIDSEKYLINILKLKELFLSAIEKYKKLLDVDSYLQNNFFSCLANLGDVQISKPLE